MSATEPQLQVKPIANIPEKKATAQDIIEQVAALQKQITDANLTLIELIDKRIIPNVPEMPYSWNVFMVAPDGSREQFTVRKTDAAEYIKSIDGIKKYLTEHGYKPEPPKTNGGNGNGASTTAHDETAPICGIHKSPMVKRQGKNGSFWSCPKKLDDGTWCPYKPQAK